MSTAADSPAPARRLGRAELRSVMCAAALRLFVRQGYAATTLAQIAAEVGYSKSAVLYHVASKEALLQPAAAAVEARLGEQVARVRAARPADRLRVLVEAWVDFSLEHRVELQAFFAEGALLRPGLDLDGLMALVDDLAGLLTAELVAAGVPADRARVRTSVLLGGTCDAARRSALDGAPPVDRDALVETALLLTGT